MKTLTNVQAIGLQINDLNEKVKAIHDDVDKRIAKAKDEGVKDDELQKLEATKDEITKVKDLNKQIEELEQKVVDSNEWNESQEKARNRNKLIAAGADDPSFREIAKTLSQALFKDDLFDEWHKSILGSDGRVKTGQFGSSPGFEVKVATDQDHFKTLVTGASSTSAGAFIITDRKPIVDPGTSYVPLTIFDFITTSPTNSDTVDYVREGTHTNNAAVVNEASATGDGTGNAPESGMVTSVVTATVKDIAHWLPATRNSLSDAPYMRTLIDKFLQYGVRKKLQSEIISGSDLSSGGIVGLSGTTAQAFDTNIVTTTRKARTKVRTTGRGTPTATGMHPLDWEAFDLLQDNEGRYYYGGPSAIGNPRLWGLPVFECEDFTQGQSVTAEWALAMLWLRENAEISISDSHSDFFTRRMIAILAVLRGAFGLIRPAAFVITDLTA